MAQKMIMKMRGQAPIEVKDEKEARKIANGRSFTLTRGIFTQVIVGSNVDASRIASQATHAVKDNSK